MTSVPATIVERIRSVEGNVAGAIEPRQIDGEVRGFAFRCPCGCGEESWLPVNRGGEARGWDWDGNVSAPTLTPSIQQNMACKWHGYLTAGIFLPC